MSTNSACEFIETEKGKWFYILENYDAPKNAWDWKEFATAYGPFSTQGMADKHLQDHHANPGGYGVVKFVEGRELSETEKRLFRRASTQDWASFLNARK